MTYIQTSRGNEYRIDDDVFEKILTMATNMMYILKKDDKLPLSSLEDRALNTALRILDGRK